VSDDALLEGPDGLRHARGRDGRAVVVKIRHAAPPGFFDAEARGLAALAASRTLRVPDVLAVAARGIVLEDLGAGRPTGENWQRAGAALARMHAITFDRFGFDTDGWCGDGPQDNTRDADGHRFFAERRLQPQGACAAASGLLDANDRRGLDRICDRLADLIPKAPAALVHGDLWIANLHACANGELALIDAGAVHHGWAEADLAMLTLFGEPPPAFFAAHEAESGVDASWRERAPLYNLHHLLNHLNLFGASYLGAVRAVLRRYG
jgi:protein-ribulosamine 3-kinase